MMKTLLYLAQMCCEMDGLDEAEKGSKLGVPAFLLLFWSLQFSFKGTHVPQDHLFEIMVYIWMGISHNTWI